MAQHLFREYECDMCGGKASIVKGRIVVKHVDLRGGPCPFKMYIRDRYPNVFLVRT